jgi:hypothetical protein
MLSKIREMPQESTPEETIRKLIGNLQSFSGHAVKSALDRLFDILEQDPEIDVSARCLRSNLSLLTTSTGHPRILRGGYGGLHPHPGGGSPLHGAEQAPANQGGTLCGYSLALILTDTFLVRHFLRWLASPPPRGRFCPMPPG